LAYAYAATDLAVGDVRADLAIILDAPYEITHARIEDRNRGKTGQQKDRFEAKTQSLKTEYEMVT
jgi:thymidylate kinase